jgi:hypothetical protein|nr:DUF6440 family protein [uncultured Oscillibacter sp.]
MAKKKGRFLIQDVSGSSMFSNTIILVDRETGVNYLFFQSANAGGLTPLLDREGKPVVTSVTDLED